MKRSRRVGKMAAALVTAALLAGCGTAPPLRRLACGAAPPLAVSLAPDGRTATATLSVLTYNIEGLGWPARGDRAPQLAEIGRRLAALRAAGRAPDVVLFQEMFSGAAKRAVAATGYPAIVTGPRRTTRALGVTRKPLPGTPRYAHGELGLHLTGSGLAIASRYPIELTARHAYGRRSCAGMDCLANKGIALARLVVPGVPRPVDLYDTHMNSRAASRAPPSRTLAAHGRQVQEAAAFIARSHDPADPIVLGGDFNMRHSEARWGTFSRNLSLGVVHRVCADRASGCDVRIKWNGDAPWMDTQDLQLFGGAGPLLIRPVRVEAMFDGGPTGPRLSDHDGFLVTYELSWPASLVAPGC